MATTDVFAAVASPVRRELLVLLRDGSRPVHELADHFELRRPTVSEHLRVLLDAGLVSEARHGRQRFYSLEPQRLLEVATWLEPFEHFWHGRFRRLQALLDEEDT